MTRRYFTIASLSILALTFLGCGDGPEDGNKSPAQVKLTPGAGDDDDKLFDESRPSDYEEDGVIDGPAEYVEEYHGVESAVMRFRYKASFKSYGKRNGGRSAWRIHRPCSSFGRQALVRFTSGKQYLVRSPQKANRSNSGFVWKPARNHNGPYIHAPFGDGSTVCTIYWG